MTKREAIKNALSAYLGGDGPGGMVACLSGVRLPWNGAFSLI
jgi:hypothetical protein